ncbi:hypothetical protein [Kribbella sindirgiensis]|uniref:Type II toxin-antitoxin system Phd/YefM family antitoxin n=1 Tax=Kribbella sindirgiensis TaxID=1124744 RepID=A0A4R0IMD3_9ACTN|nr:hypothetical protein [Kribbella sindirgiensis]TCC33540.1 hypothetical protein E0H50_16360 [Kribbella sindirgiensis]
MQTPYELPNGDTAMVTDTATAAQSLGRAVELWREGATEPLFYGSEGRPEGVVISFDQWAEYEALKLEAAFDRRMENITRERVSNFRPEHGVPFDDLVREYGWTDSEEPEDEGGKS